MDRQDLKVYKEVKEVFNLVYQELDKVIVGQRGVIENLIIALLCDGHVLIEGYPGLGKTMIIKNLGRILDLNYSRVQCTPDLMPSDITGTYIIEEQDGKKVFRFERGPVFTNILLADEINRATPKAQSALLEAMQERQVTIGNETHVLEAPFFVLATQNPLEMEGTYPLPEAQLDRFLFKVMIGYSSPEEERRIVDMYTRGGGGRVEKVLNRKTLLSLQRLTRQVPISDELKKHAIDLVAATRDKGNTKANVEYGASPRASIGLVLSAKARALIRGRNYVSREDVVEMAFPILRHRIILTFDAERKGVTQDDVVRGLLDNLK